ncbi:hypothetical protein N8T08_010852 [Aspergillus melleus]|uniref:Uncharacterized protein n=1 Tax=Aspergillus melleus TaxID=138277 RepID=A0ACC3ARM7_9EURO|nr:hypothetical protein N8T08_010852 [Aspergillus melleus]
MPPSPSSSRILISLLLTTSLAFPLTTSSPATIPSTSFCYHPNGTPETDPIYQSCSQTTGATGMCCAATDVCLPNGLCQSTRETEDREGEKMLQNTYRRGHCTSRDWEGGGCLGVCVDGKGSNTSPIMTPCDNNTNISTTWCCGNTNDCCGTPDAITIAPVLGEHISIPSPTSYASSSTTTNTAIPVATSTFTHSFQPIPSTSTSTSTTFSTPTPSTTTQTHPSSRTETAEPEKDLPGLSNGVKAGIGVSVSVAVLIIFVAVAFLLRRIRRPKVVAEREFVSSVTLTPASMPMPMPMAGLEGEGRGVFYGSRGGRPSGSGKEGYIREDGVGVEGRGGSGRVFR